MLDIVDSSFTKINRPLNAASQLSTSNNYPGQRYQLTTARFVYETMKVLPSGRLLKSTYSIAEG